MSEINLTSLSIYNMSGPPGLLFFHNPLGTIITYVNQRVTKVAHIFAHTSAAFSGVLRWQNCSGLRTMRKSFAPIAARQSS